MKTALLCTLLFVVSGCVSVSPVLPTGENEYMISVVSHNQGKEAIVSGIQQANAFCAKSNRTAEVTATKTAGTDLMSSSKAQVWFTCEQNAE